METLADFPFAPYHVDRDAAPDDPSEADALLDHLREHEPTDLLVLAHGWNNDLGQARDLFERLLANLRDLRADDGPAVVPLDLPVLGVFWPSKRFAPSHLIAGGAASAGGDAPADALDAELDALADALGPEAAGPLARAKALVPLLDESATQDAFVDVLRDLLPSADDPIDDDPADRVPPRLRTEPGRHVLDLLEAPLPPAPLPNGGRPAGGVGEGGAADRSAGGAAGLGDALRGVRAAALRLANLTTYYVMKRRAGLVGRQALVPLLDRVAAARPGLRVHLVGHSFGGRLVTAAAAQVETPAQSLTLLQAAFSHHGLAQAYDGERDGAFRAVLSASKVRGPVLVTHTANDRAVGLAYPLASRLAGHTASGLGDASDPFGGIGRNGAQSTPEAVDERLLPLGQSYALRPGVVHNLLADDFIPDHGTVHGPEVAAALAAVLAS